jgi:hypothetical protein
MPSLDRFVTVKEYRYVICSLDNLHYYHNHEQVCDADHTDSPRWL